MTMPLSTTVSLAILLVISLQLNSTNASNKGASQASKKCQQYGHSCLGGHGKRSQTQPLMPFLPTFVGRPQSSAEDRNAKMAASLSQLYRLPLGYATMANSLPKSKWQLKNMLESNSLDVPSPSSDTVWESDAMPVPTPTGTDPDGEMRENLISLLNSPLGHRLAPFLPLSVLKKLNINQRPLKPVGVPAPLAADSEEASIANSGQQQQWEMLAPMKKAATGMAGRVRRSAAMAKLATTVRSQVTAPTATPLH